WPAPQADARRSGRHAERIPASIRRQPLASIATQNDPRRVVPGTSGAWEPGLSSICTPQLVIARVMQQTGKGKTESVRPCGKSVDKADKRWIAVLKLCLFSGSSEMVRVSKRTEGKPTKGVKCANPPGSHRRRPRAVAARLCRQRAGVISNTHATPCAKCP